MFSQTFVDNVQKPKEPLAFALSVLLETCALGLLILIPLIYTDALPSAQLKSLLTAPRTPTAQSRTLVEIKPQRFLVARRLSVLVAPSVVPNRISTRTDELAAADISIPGFTSGGTAATDNLFTGVIGSLPGPPPAGPVSAPTSKNATGPLKVTTGVAEANLIRRVMPLYPPLAKSARVQGTVEFTAVISKEGTIENLRLVRGHPLLVEAAREAVLQWKYRPTLLNGRPVEVVTDILVNFTLSN